MKRPLVIAVSAVSGGGKSTVVQGLKDRLKLSVKLAKLKAIIFNKMCVPLRLNHNL